MLLKHSVTLVRLIVIFNVSGKSNENISLRGRWGGGGRLMITFTKTCYSKLCRTMVTLLSVNNILSALSDFFFIKGRQLRSEDSLKLLFLVLMILMVCTLRKVLIKLQQQWLRGIFSCLEQFNKLHEMHLERDIFFQFCKLYLESISLTHTYSKIYSKYSVSLQENNIR